MTDLTELLDRASDVGETPMPLTDDLARAHAALRRRRVRRGLATAGTVGAVVLIGIAGQAAFDRAPDGTDTVTESPAAQAVLLKANESAGPYTFGKLPVDWEVQGEFPQGVTIAQIGDDDQEPLSFIGKLVIMYDQNRPSGDSTMFNGREFFSRSGGGDHSTVSVRTRAGEPEGVVSVQYPDSAGWDVATMIEFLDAVEVGPGAQPGLG
jgi:hypothetical protein